jgi:hypothetical protein
MPGRSYAARDSLIIGGACFLHEKCSEKRQLRNIRKDVPRMC